MRCKHHLIETKATFALLSPICSIPARAFLSCGTSPYYNKSLYRQGGHKPGLRAYHHHNRQRQSLWQLACEHLSEYGNRTCFEGSPEGYCTCCCTSVAGL